MTQPSECKFTVGQQVKLKDDGGEFAEANDKLAKWGGMGFAEDWRDKIYTVTSTSYDLHNPGPQAEYYWFVELGDGFSVNEDYLDPA